MLFVEMGTVTAVAEEEPPAKPTRFALHQNIPNPFNPVTTITYEIPTASHVKLTIYDLQGREVAVLVNADKPAGEFNAAGLASGIYFYQVVSGGYEGVREMVVLR